MYAHNDGDTRRLWDDRQHTHRRRQQRWTDVREVFCVKMKSMDGERRSQASSLRSTYVPSSSRSVS